jgi:hypothetical protein
MPRRLLTTYAMLPRGGSGTPPAPPPPPPPLPPSQDPALSQGEEEKDSDDEEFLAELPTNAEAEEAAAEQRAIVASFETQRRDRAVQELMAAERRAAAARLAEDHTAARADAHRHNIEAARAAMAEAERCLFWVDVAVGLAKVAAEHQHREHQYPLPSFNASAQRAQERHTFISSLEEAEHDRSQRAAEENRRCRGMVSGRLSDDGAGPSNTSPPAPSAASVNFAAGENRRRRGMVSGRLSNDGAGSSNDSSPAQSAASVNFTTGEDSDEDHLF